MQKNINKVNVNIAFLLTLTSLGIAGITLHNYVGSKEKIVTNDNIEVIELDISDTNNKADIEITNVRDRDPNLEVINLDKEIIDLDGLNEEKSVEILELNNEIVNPEILEETLNDKEYSGMNLSNEYEEYLENLCNEYAELYNIDKEFLFQSVLTIGYQESNGKWDNNGVVSSTDDLGEFQINVCNLKDANSAFGYTYDDLVNDKYKNANYAIYHLCKDIMNSSYCRTKEDVFGMYNGWINWRDKKDAVKYAESCMNILEEYFESNNKKI